MGQQKRDSDFNGQKRWYNKTNHLTFCFYVFHAFINVVLLYYDVLGMLQIRNLLVTIAWSEIAIKWQVKSKKPA